MKVHGFQTVGEDVRERLNSPSVLGLGHLLDEDTHVDIGQHHGVDVP